MSNAETIEKTETEFSIPEGVYGETVTEVQHYTDRLFRFRITRPASFRFRSAYSIASPSWDETLEFFSIKVPDGPLTQHLQKIKEGDTIIMRKKPTGTLVNDALIPGKRLWMFSTGTGIAPFASLIRDPETYEKFEEVILTHTCREVSELKYGQDLVEKIKNDPLVGELTEGRLRHYCTVTREDYPYQGRITDLMRSGKVFDDLGVPAITPEVDRGMICGSMDMLNETKEVLEGFSLEEGANNKPATFVVERTLTSKQSIVRKFFLGRSVSS